MTSCTFCRSFILLCSYHLGCLGLILYDSSWHLLYSSRIYINVAKSHRAPNSPRVWGGTLRAAHRREWFLAFANVPSLRISVLVTRTSVYLPCFRTKSLGVRISIRANHSSGSPTPVTAVYQTADGIIGKGDPAKALMRGHNASVPINISRDQGLTK